MKDIAKKICSGIIRGITAALLIVFCVFTLPHFMGIQVFAVASGSMEPFYPIGALIFTHQAAPEEIYPGDCITYTLGSGTITHRVLCVNQSGRTFLTKGDANTAADFPVGFGQLVGKSDSFYIPLLGYLVIWIKKSKFRVFIIIISAVLLLGISFLEKTRLFHHKTR